MFEYQQSHRYFAQTSETIQEPAIGELQQLGAKDVRQAFRGVYFESDVAGLFRINYQARFVSRILAPLIKFTCHNTKYLYRKAKEVQWDQLFSPDDSFAIFANVANSKITHSQYAALCVKDAIADYFNEQFNKRPNVDKQDPDVWINLHIVDNFATISLDTSGGSLHRRGYRVETVEAPMQETVAAAIIRWSGWDGTVPLFDPMCGSGTLLAEALMSYCQLPAGYRRPQFGFERLPEFDAATWNSIKDAENSKMSELPPDIISGSDISYNAVRATFKNIRQLPGAHNVKINVLDFQKIEKLKNTVIVCNPPYGIRMGDKAKVKRLLEAFGDFLKQRCTGCVAYVYFGDRSLIPAIGLRTSFKQPLKNGGLDGRLCKFEIY